MGTNMLINIVSLCLVSALVSGAQYPAGVSPAACPNYPDCSLTPAGYAGAVSAYPAGAESDKVISPNSCSGVKGSVPGSRCGLEESSMAGASSMPTYERMELTAVTSMEGGPLGTISMFLAPALLAALAALCRGRRGRTAAAPSPICTGLKLARYSAVIETAASA